MKRVPETDADGGSAELRAKVSKAYKDAIEALSWLSGAEYDLVRKDICDRFGVHASTIQAAVRKLRKDRRAEEARAVAAASGKALTVEDFVAYMPTGGYIFLPTMEMWVASSVDARVPPVSVGDAGGGSPEHQPASQWLRENRAVEQLTWMPGEPQFLKDVLVTENGRGHKKGCTTLNRYQRPQIERWVQGDPSPWLVHLDRVYPDDADHILCCLAHRVQRPGEKINHALVLGGEPGIGKDTLLVPLVAAVGPGNFADIAPDALVGQWTAFGRSVILRINEVHDLGDTDRYKFYERSKRYCVAPPDVLQVNEKNLRQYHVTNVCFPIMTTNHRTDGLYLPANDRRHYVAWSPRKASDFTPEYWAEFYSWYDNDGGIEIVADYLANLDLDHMGFNPKAPPPKTEAFWTIVSASATPEDAEMADVLERLGNPEAVTLAMLADEANVAGGSHEFSRWLRDRGNSRKIPHRMEACGYTSVRHLGAKDGLWVVKGKRQAIYVRSGLTPTQRLAAAKNLVITEVYRASRRSAGWVRSLKSVTTYLQYYRYLSDPISSRKIGSGSEKDNLRRDGDRRSLISTISPSAAAAATPICRTRVTHVTPGKETDMSFTDDYGHQHFAPTIIAAPAGAFTALTWHRLDDLAGHSVELPVIAFDCSDTAFPRPIAILSMGQVQAIRYADGRVLDLPDGCEFADRGAWHQHAKTRANEWAVEASR